MTFSERLESIRIGSFSLSVLLSALITLIVCLIVRKILKKLLEHSLVRSRLNKTLRSFVDGAVNVIAWIVIISVVADKLGIPMTSLVAVLSVAGLALSLSLQGLLENLFPGVIILGTKPLAVGDYIEVGGLAGTVRSVGLFHTVIVTLDNRTVYIPNNTVTTSTVVNYTACSTRRIDLAVSASYDDAAEAVKAALLDAAAAAPGILKEPLPTAFVQKYGDSGIEYGLWAWTATPDYLAAKAALTESIRTAFEKRGVSMTYNHLNVHIVENRK